MFLFCYFFVCVSGKVSPLLDEQMAAQHFVRTQKKGEQSLHEEPFPRSIYQVGTTNTRAKQPKRKKDKKSAMNFVIDTPLSFVT